MLLLLLACNPGGSTSDTADASGPATTSTSADPPTTGGIGGTETSAATTTSGGSLEGTGTSTGATGSTSEASGSTSGSTSDATSAATSGGPTTDATTSEATSGESTGGESTGGVGLVLDPSTLEDFWLPINSIRAGVGGFDPVTKSCVSVIFFFDSHPDSLAQHCSFAPMELFPYVVVTPDSAPPCQQWDYGGNVTVTAASGCMQVMSEDPIDIAIDMTIEVQGGPFPGTITVQSP